MLDCPAYDHIRESFPTILSLPAPWHRLQAAFDFVDQQALVHSIWHMDLYRCHLLGLKSGHDSRVRCQPYIPADRALWGRADFGMYDSSSVGGTIAVVLLLLCLVIGCMWWLARL